MKYYQSIFFAASLIFVACNGNTASSEKEKVNTPVIKEESVSYGTDSAKLTGFVAYDSASTKKRPVVLIVHEWWGLK